MAHHLNFDLQQVSLTLCNEEGRSVVHYQHKNNVWLGNTSMNACKICTVCFQTLIIYCMVLKLDSKISLEAQIFYPYMGVTHLVDSLEVN